MVREMVRTEAMVKDVSPLMKRDAFAGPTPFSIDLGTLPEVLQKSEPQSAAGLSSMPTKIGSAREVPPAADSAVVSQRLQWSFTGRGDSVAAIRIRSAGAMGLRLGVRVGSLPMGSRLRFYSSASSTEAQQIPAQEILATIQRNLDAGDPVDEARTWWSPDLGGEEATMEIELPPGADRAGVEISVPRVSHIFTALGKEVLQVRASSGSCNLDEPCDPTLDNESRSVARMIFVDRGLSYLCTGTLVNDKKSDGIPYFLSANHCISSQSVASSLSTDWFYRSTNCNSGFVSPETRRLTGGATLLFASATTDTSFMRLNNAPPVGAVYSGWNADPVSMSSDVLGIHSPNGDFQKYSKGAISAFLSCTTASSSTFLCASSTVDQANFLQTRWSQGITEGGSSGSGLFVTINGNRYLVGQLLGGSSSCSAPNSPDIYGRFDKAYRDAVYQWLSAGEWTRVPVFRFYNTQTGAHFWTSSVNERDTVIRTLPRFNYEGVAFYAYPSATAGSSPVYRFYNGRSGSHFYTVGTAERDDVRARLPDFSYEGPAWEGSVGPLNGSIPMYRFYNSTTGAHFYTLGTVERDDVIARLPAFHYEGPAYQAWSSP